MATTVYAKLKADLELHDKSSYTDLIWANKDDQFQINTDDYENYLFFKVDAATGGTTVDLGSFTSVGECILFSGDATNYVDATFRNTANSSTDNIVRLDAGDWLKLGEVTVANDLVLTANGAAVEVYILALGA